MRRSKTKSQQGAHIHQPVAWPVPHACAQPYHPGSGSHGQLSSFALIGAHQRGIAVGSMNGENSRVSKTVKGVCMPLAVSLSYEE